MWNTNDDQILETGQETETRNVSTLSKNRQNQEMGYVCIIYRDVSTFSKMGKIKKCGNVSIPHFKKMTKIGVSIIVSIPHCPTVWNTNDDR